MQDKLNHHILPRLYLKGFASSGDYAHIWEFRRGSPFHTGKNKRDKFNPVLISLNKAAAAKGEYAIQRLDGTIDYNTFENELEQIEKPANPILEKLRDRQSIDDDERLTLANYMVNLILRVPSRKEFVKRSFPEVTERVLKAAQDQLDHDLRELNPLDIEGIACRLANYNLKCKAIEQFEQGGMPREMELRSIVDGNIPRVRTAILNMSWQFFVAPPGSHFVTGDNPVHTFKGGIGLSKPYSELVFPVSASIALLGTFRKLKDEFPQASRQIVHEFNRRIIASASNNVYACRGEEWIWKILSKNFHQFRAIYPSEFSGTILV